jgi:hypothetical protein
MNDLELLRDAWDTPDAPSTDAAAQARAALLARATQRRRSWLGVRVAVVGAAAAAIAVGVAVLDEDRVAPAGAAQVLERAAAASEAKPFVAPRADQWVYTEVRFTRSDAREPETWSTWHRADGRGMAWIDEAGKLRLRGLEPPQRGPVHPARRGLLEGYAAIAALPTDPEALLQWAYAQAKHITNGPDSTDESEIYLLFNHMLRDNVLPPELEAAIFRALKEIPGVTVSTVDVLGRPSLALAMTTADWLREELLLDPQTYTYRGERSTVVKDAFISPEKAGNATGRVTKGSVVVAERVVAAIVDRPGERR